MIIIYTVLKIVVNFISECPLNINTGNLTK